MPIKFDRIYIELSNICNFSCPFCSSVMRPSRSMSQDEVTSALSQAKQFTDEVCLHVLGEPLLYPQLAEVFAHCRTLRLKINIVTNGYHIARCLSTIIEYIDVIKKVNFSVHSYVYHPEGIDQHMADIMAAAVAVAGRNVSVELRNLRGNCDDAFKASLINAVKASTGVDLIDIDHNQKIMPWLYYVIKPPFSWPDRTKEGDACALRQGKLYCLGGRSHIAVLSDLTVVPCCLDCGGEIALGSLNDSTLSCIVSNTKFTALLQDFARGKAAHTLCSTCRYSQR